MQRKHRRAEGSVTQKRGLWYAILSTGRDQRGQQTRHWSKGFDTRRKAEHALAQLMIGERRIKEKRADVRQVVSSYVERDITPRGRRSPTTTQRYRGLLENMKPFWNERVDHLDETRIESFYMALIERAFPTRQSITFTICSLLIPLGKE